VENAQKLSDAATGKELKGLIQVANLEKDLTAATGKELKGANAPPPRARAG
jgi:hypothetical protein